MRRLLAALLSLACLHAAAQAPLPPNEQAKALANKLGRERSAEGLETILKAGNADLFAAYQRGLSEGPTRDDEKVRGLVPMPPALEALMVRYYADPVLGARLPELCADNILRCGSPELFRLMLAEWRSPKPRVHTYKLANAAARFESEEALAALTAWLTAPDAPKGEDRETIVRTLGQQKYARAVPALAALVLQPPPGTSSHAAHSLSQIGTPAAVEALLARLAATKRAPQTPAIVQEARTIASNLAQLPPSVPIAYSQLRAVLPAEVREFSIPWLATRKDLSAVPDVLLLLAEPDTYPRALEALVASDSPEVWKQARAAVEKAKKDNRLAENQYRYAAPMLDAKIADPGKHANEQRDRKREQELRTHHSLLVRDLEEARRLKATNPKRFVDATREYSAAVRKLAADYSGLPTAQGLLHTLPSMNMEVAHVLRFRLKQPREAIALYEEAAKAGDVFAAFAIADTLQFDLRDTPRALAEYRKAIAPTAPEAPSRDDQGQVMKAWGQRWLAAQVEFLARSKTYSGALRAEDLMVGSYLLQGAGQGENFGLEALRPMLQRSMGKPESVDRAEVDRVLKAMPPSAFALHASLPYVSYLPDARSILAHLARHDPAGFASATYFGVLDAVDRGPDAADMMRMVAPGMRIGAGSDPLREARTRFLAERRIDTKAVKAALDAMRPNRR